MAFETAGEPGKIMIPVSPLSAVLDEVLTAVVTVVVSCACKYVAAALVKR